MNKQRLLELAGIILTESRDDLKKRARDLLIGINKFHGDIVLYKQKSHEKVASLEDGLYKLVSELDKFIEKKEINEGKSDWRVNWERLDEIKYLLNQSSMMRGEEKQLSEEEVKTYNTLLQQIETLSKKIHTLAYNAKERYKKKG